MVQALINGLSIHILQRMTTEQKGEWIPAHLNKSAAAPVKEFFDSSVQKASDGYLISFFRGHELTGLPLDLPTGYRSVLAKAKGNSIEVQSILSTINVWDLDKVSLGNTIQFSDAVAISNILAEDD